jgi:uncharacterized small protein (DUF1192 family)
MPSDFTIGADRAPVLPIPESISYRLCAEFAAGLRRTFHAMQAAEGLFGSVFCRPKARLFPLTSNGWRAARLTSAFGATKIVKAWERTMAATDPDEAPKKKVSHEMGQDLSLLSLGELSERIALLKEEIARLEAEIARKRASKSAADVFFKK